MMRSITATLLLAAVCLHGCEQQSPPPAAKPPADAPTTVSKAPPSATVSPQTPAPPVTKPETPAAAADPHAGLAMPKAPAADPHAGLDMAKATSSDPHAGLNLPKMPPADPHAATDGTRAAVPHQSATELVGISLSVPEGWVAETADANPSMPQLAPKAAYGLAPAEGDSKGAQVRVTHYPEMKGKDEMNLERWYGQFTQPDGRPTKDVTKVENFDLGEIKILLADIPGTMMVAGAATPDQRMLSAIINHPKGPHFVKVLGPDKTVAKWRDSVVAYLKSSKIKSE